MATTQALTATQRIATPNYANAYLAQSVLSGAGGGTTWDFRATAGATEPVAELEIGGANPLVRVWLTERLAANYAVTTSTPISLSAWLYNDPTVGANATVRFHLYRVNRTTAEETLFATYDGTTAKDTTLSADTHTFTVTRDIQLAAGERILIRAWAIPPSGGSMTAGVLRWNVGGGSAGNGYTALSFPDEMTFVANRTRLYLRDTASAVGGVFKELSTTAGAGLVTKTVNTTAGGTEIHWTVTGGGAHVAWISARFKEPWRLASNGTHGFGSVAAINFWVTAHESNAAANASVRFKAFRWRAGVETEAYTVDYSGELSTSTTGTLPVGSSTGLSDITTSQALNNVLTTTDFQVDDRLVFRAYLINRGTMASGHTGGLRHNAASGNGFSYVELFETALFKGESDPADEPTNAGTMTGMQN
jgi:hypothetical protein